jgi:hypothetical protein
MADQESDVALARIPRHVNRGMQDRDIEAHLATFSPCPSVRVTLTGTVLALSELRLIQQHY